MSHADFSDMLQSLARYASLVDSALDKRLPRDNTPPPRLHRAIRYAVFAGGKRIRPALCLNASELCGGSASDALPAACALEMIHTYSLIHDDLPAMDDDTLRRGKPTLHIAFDEATAILAGDALLTEAFGMLADTPRTQAVPGMVRLLSDFAGLKGMVIGQQFDLDATDNPILTQSVKISAGPAAIPEAIRRIHIHKTAALIRASVRLGARCAGASPDQCAALDAYGLKLGLAYQIADDCLDATSTPEQLGKTPGKDAAQHKTTIVSALGLDDAKAWATRFASDACDALDAFGDSASFLKDLAVYAAARSR